MADHSQQRSPEREAIDEPQEHMDDQNDVDELGQQALGDDRVLLDQFRQVVQARRDGHSEEAEADNRAGVADER